MKKQYFLSGLFALIATTLSYGQFNLVSLSPVDDATDVPTSTTTLQLVVAGNYTKASTGSVQIFDEDANSMAQFIGNASAAITFSYDGSANTTITVDLSATSFSFGEGNYSVVVKKALFGGTDAATLQANTSGADYTTRTNWNFTTIQVIEIGTLISLSPANGESNVAADADLEIVVKGNYSAPTMAPAGGIAIFENGTQTSFIGGLNAAYNFNYDSGTGNTTITLDTSAAGVVFTPTGTYSFDVKELLFSGVDGPTLQATSGTNYIARADWSFDSSGTLSSDNFSRINAIITAQDGVINVINAKLDEVYNIAGQKVSNTGLSSGIYIIKISKDSKVETRKIVF